MFDSLGGLLAVHVLSRPVLEAGLGSGDLPSVEEAVETFLRAAAHTGERR